MKTFFLIFPNYNTMILFFIVVPLVILLICLILVWTSIKKDEDQNLGIRIQSLRKKQTKDLQNIDSDEKELIRRPFWASSVLGYSGDAHHLHSTTSQPPAPFQRILTPHPPPSQLHPRILQNPANSIPILPQTFQTLCR